MGVLPPQEDMWLKELVELKVAITHDLDEALRSNGQLAYVPPTSRNISLLATYTADAPNPDMSSAKHQKVQRSPCFSFCLALESHSVF